MSARSTALSQRFRGSLPVSVLRFRNDIHIINSREEAITLLIHFGYLIYDSGAGTARIPNEEVRTEFAALLKNPRYHSSIPLENP